MWYIWFHSHKVISYTIVLLTEAVTKVVSKIAHLKSFAEFTRTSWNTGSRAFLFLQVFGLELNQKESLLLVLSCEICKIFQRRNFKEHLRMNAFS